MGGGGREGDDGYVLRLLADVNQRWRVTERKKGHVKESKGGKGKGRWNRDDSKASDCTRKTERENSTRTRMRKEKKGHTDRDRAD